MIPLPDPLPADYEPCGECGFDHSYEYGEAYRAHSAIEARASAPALAPESGPRLVCPSSRANPHGWRFEVRAARTGYLQEAFASVTDAIEYSLNVNTPACFIVDLALPIAENDPRIVWIDGSPTPAALEWIAGHCLYTV